MGDEFNCDDAVKFYAKQEDSKRRKKSAPNPYEMSVCLAAM